MLIVGSGAVATLVAQKLAAEGPAFQIYGPPSDRTQALKARFGRSVITDPAEVLPGQDWLVAVKSWQNDAKVQALRGASPAARILVVQNGLHPETVWSELSHHAVERGLCSYGVRIDRPGKVVGGEEGEFVLQSASSFSQRLRSAGFRCREVMDFEAACWHKLAVNASLNVVASLHGFTNGEVLNHAQASALARAVSREVREVALAEGVDWGEADPWILTSRIAAQTSSNVCSTLADLRAGRPTEYDSINGELIRRGQASGLPVPALLELDRRFHGLRTGSGWEQAC